MKDILEKLKGVLSEDDLNALRNSIETQISESVSLKVEEIKLTLEKDSESTLNAKLEEAKVEIEKTLAEKYEKDLESLNEQMIDSLDKFLEVEIVSKIDSNLVSKVAVNETLEPLVKHIKEGFENLYVALDTEGHGLVKGLKEGLESANTKLSEAIADKMELVSKIEKLEVESILLKKTSDLTESQKERVNKMFGGKSLSEVNDKIDTFIEIINEANSDAKPATNINENTDVNFENVTPVSEKKQEKEKTVANIAASYL